MTAVSAFVSTKHIAIFLNILLTQVLYKNTVAVVLVNNLCSNNSFRGVSGIKMQMGV